MTALELYRRRGILDCDFVGGCNLIAWQSNVQFPSKGRDFPFTELAFIAWHWQTCRFYYEYVVTGILNWEIKKTKAINIFCKRLFRALRLPSWPLLYERRLFRSEPSGGCQLLYFLPEKYRPSLLHLKGSWIVTETHSVPATHSQRYPMAITVVEWNMRSFSKYSD